jgi:DNA-binding HxlR family transcriptional regulator
MSVRVVTRDNTNTLHINTLLTNPLYLQIMNALAREELTFHDLAELLKRDEEKLSHELDVLVKTGAVKRHFHHHTVLYTLAQHGLKHTIHILYELWAEQIRLAGHGDGMKI